MSKTLVKMEVCISCMSPVIIDPDCICTYQRGYETIELEFKKCSCCGNVDTWAADTPFNDKQYETLRNNKNKNHLP